MFLIIDLDILIAPVNMEGTVDRQVYLTTDTDWIDKSTQESFSVGTWLSAQAPLGRLPLYQRKGPEATW
jgi:alpha-glucosidase (family GH31 glycosyl hydrolase)